MQVRCVGFKIKANGTPSYLFDYLSHLAGQPNSLPQNPPSNGRLMLVGGPVGNFYRGVHLLFPSRKAYLEFIRGTAPAVSTAAYPNPPVEVNYFLIHKYTLKGIYLYYRGSLSPMPFGKEFGRQFNPFASTLSKKIRNGYQFELMYSKDSFDKIIENEFNDIDSITLDASEVLSSPHPFDPKSQVVSSTKIEYSFARALNRDSKLAAIRHIINNYPLTFGKVTGNRAGVLNAGLDIFDNLDLFHQEDYEAILPSMQIDRTNFLNTPVFNLLESKVAADPRIIT